MVNISCRPEEAMLENWQKLVFYWNIFLFFESSWPVSALKMSQNRMKNMHLYIPQDKEVLKILKYGEK